MSTGSHAGPASVAAGHPAEDPVLGPQPVRHGLKALGREFLVPRVREGLVIGSYRTVASAWIVPDFHYRRRLDLLDLMPLDALSYYTRGVRTGYFRSQRGWWRGLRKLARYRSLYRSISRHGLIRTEGDPFSVPWLFACDVCHCRLDGHHRASLARLLGHERMTALVITPAEVLALAELPARFRELLRPLSASAVDLAQPPPSSN